MKKFSVLLALLILIPNMAFAEETALIATPNLIAIGALLAALLAGMLISAKRIRWNAHLIAKAAICIALAYILSMIRMFRMPMGGSVKLAAMLPLILFSVSFGPLEGLLIGSAYGLLDLLMDPYIIHPIQMLVDYPMAYAALALSCAANLLPIPKRLHLPAAVLLGYLGRYIMAVLSGVIFFAEYAGEQGAWVYSLTYNLAYLGVEALISMAIACIPGMDRLPQILKQNAVR